MDTRALQHLGFCNVFVQYRDYSKGTPCQPAKTRNNMYHAHVNATDIDTT